jgi:UPF0755 protein
MPVGCEKNRITIFKVMLAGLLILAWIIIQAFTELIPVQGNVTIVVPPKSSTTYISEVLQENNLIRSAVIFKLYAKITGFEKSLQAGQYKFSGFVSLQDIKNKMTKGQMETKNFTIPEGYTLNQIAELLSKKGLVNKDKFMEIAQNGVFPYNYLPPSGEEHRLEGFLFPDTYRLSGNYSEKEVIEIMLARFDQIYDQEWHRRTEEMGMTVQEIVTMASIIEREAKVPVDRPLIAGVFYNRLERKMCLESCATVQYALGKQKSVLLYKDLMIKSPYNTYNRTGLPPKPIASPGKDSLKAALYPSDTDYLFFVAKRDGSHYFSRSLPEHIRAKRKYLE